MVGKVEDKRRGRQRARLIGGVIETANKNITNNADEIDSIASMCLCYSWHAEVRKTLPDVYR